MSLIDTALRGPRRRPRRLGGDSRPGLWQGPGGRKGRGGQGEEDRQRLLARLRRQATRRARRRLALALIVVSAPFLFFLAVLVMFAASGRDPALEPSETAVADIPASFLELYQAAGPAEGIDWAILAGIGKLECDHGRSELDGCDMGTINREAARAADRKWLDGEWQPPPLTVNRAGARGPMQFLGSTWRAGAGRFEPDVSGPPIPTGQESQGYATDGNGDGNADPWNPADAIFAAARYLRRNGAPDDDYGAIYAYNRSDDYVNRVLLWAGTYRGAAEAAGVGGDSLPEGVAEMVDVRGITVNASIADQLEAMLTAAEADGVDLTGRGYRSPEVQIELRKQHCGTSHYAIYEMPSSQCSPPTAKPGTSLHQQGLAIDFRCPQAGPIRDRSSRCFQWLSANAATYGLYNLPSEPWHWSIDGS